MARTQHRKDSLLTRGPTVDVDGRERGEEEEAAKSEEDEGDTEDRLRSAAIPLVRSWADRRAADGIYAFRRRLNADVYGLV